MTPDGKNDKSVAPKSILSLVERFELYKESYRSGQYNEAQLRHDFLDPFWEILGWDIHNKQGFAEAYRDVIYEDALRIGHATKAPDYCFRIGGTRKFFLEAKKPSVLIKEDVSPAFQLRRYAWSAKLPLSVLSNFEEFVVYDTHVRPVKDDPAPTARIFCCTFREYAEKWDWIASIFSHDAVLKGSFDKFAEGARAKRGTASVDDAFLDEIESWRKSLAQNLALRNPKLTQRELNFAVQCIIDRIIFLRICEDRNIEDYGRLLALVNSGDIYQRLCELFQEADDKYNSGLFHFKTEKGRHEPPDELTPGLHVDDKLLRDVLRNLYYPESPYEFSVLSIDILGQVYERFLGKTIRLTEGHRAVVEDKSEVKKAGGIYYTPTYIVNYIVKNTVGKLLEGKTPAQVAKLRILDPACGSGSFLIGAYQYLLDWHLDWYVVNDPKKRTKGSNPALLQAGARGWRLTIAERKRILLNNIFGVDIDSQAVEVTKLSLLLKVLEGETEQTLQPMLRFLHERALPDLGDNIKCGNSLIGSDYFEARLVSDEEEMRRVNPFNWRAEFAEVMQAGGFDAVIGNPPYGAWFRDPELEYFDRHYEVFRGVKDVYTCFVQKGMRLLKTRGRLSYIVPSAWLGGPRYVRFRSFLLGHQIENIVVLPFDVFPDAYIDTAIAVISGVSPPKSHAVRTFSYGKREQVTAINPRENQYQKVQQQKWQSVENKKFVLDFDALQLVERLRPTCGRTIGDVALMKRGVLFDSSLLTKRRETDNHYRYFQGDIYRYRANVKSSRWVEFGPRMKEKPKEFFWFQGTRILLRRLVNRQQRLMAMLVAETFITNKNLYTILPRGDAVDPRVLLAVVNSKLVSHLYLKQVSQATKDDFPQVTVRDMCNLPFPPASRVSGHSGRLAALVERILALQKNLAAATIPLEKARYQRQTEATDAQIDRLVYELYGLTEQEIKIVESAT